MTKSVPADKPEADFLRRWSRRKLAAAREAEVEPANPAAALPSAPDTPQAAPASAAEPRGEPPEATDVPPLPDVASLTFDSDFKPFLAPGVDEGTRRAALRKLFADPHFNTMDGLDVYIDDYSKFEPVTPEVLKKLAHVRYLFDPPKTRVNEQGHVEDVPDEPSPVADAAPTDPASADTAPEALPPGLPAGPAVALPQEPAPVATAPDSPERPR